MLENAVILIVSGLSAGAVFGGIYAIRTTPLKTANAFAAGLFLAYLISLAFPPAPAFISNALILAGAVGLGYFLSHFLTSKANLIAFCIAAGAVDYLSFSGGLTAKIITLARSGDPDLFKHLVIYWPRGGAMTALIGVGDLVVLGSLFSALLELKRPAWLAFAVPVLGLSLALLTGMQIGGVWGIPFIAGATVLYLLVRPIYLAAAGAIYLVFLYLIWPTL